MSLLAGIVGKPTSASLSSEENEINAAIGEEGLVEFVTTSNAMDIATSRLNNLLNVSEVLDVVECDSKSARQLGRLMVAQALTDLDMPVNDAVAATAGLESETANVGNEAFATVKQYVSSIIEWIQKKWKELKRFIAKYWNKYFGDVERLVKGWQKTKAKVETKQDGFTLDKSAKAEFTKGADYFFDDAVVKGDQLAAKTRALLVMAKDLGKTFLKENIDAPNIETLLVAGANDAKEFSEDGRVLKAMPALEGVDKEFNGVVDQFRNFEDTAKKSVTLLGRKAIYIGWKAVVDGDHASQAAGAVCQFGDVVDKQKTKDSVSLEPVDLSEVTKLADVNIELLETIVDIKRSKLLDKAEDQIDKINKDLGKWLKQAPTESAQADERAAYRKALAVATAEVNLQRKLYISFPREFCGYVKTVSQMQKVFADKSIAAHKKAD